ncbi:MAG: hypothetical protein ACOYLR_06205 [Chlorobium sp.]
MLIRNRIRQTALLFCINLSGHRQIYTYVFADWLLKKGFHVILALGIGQEGLSGFELPILKTLLNRKCISLVKLGPIKFHSDALDNSVNTILELEKQYDCSLTLFPTGDDLRYQISRLGKYPRQLGLRRVAVWINMPYVYPEDLRDYPLYIQLSKRIRTSYFRIRDKYFFRYKVWNFYGLDQILTTNPDFILSISSPKFKYIPEIYLPWGCEKTDLCIFDDNLKKKVLTFLVNNKQKTLLFYYGNWAARRGFDDLLALAVDYQDTVFISFGRPGSDTNYLRDVPRLMRELHNQGRILDVRIPFIPFHPIVSDLFRATQFMVLPYRNFYGMSGSMIEAASFGKPVLVPDIGYMNARVKQYGIGISYQHRNYDDLCIKFQLMRSSSDNYVENVIQFSYQFNDENIYSAIDRTDLNLV